jgi:ribosome-binding factor A
MPLGANSANLSPPGLSLPKAASGRIQRFPGIRESMRRKPRIHKTQQLCSQVAETLDQVLGGECGDDVLRALRVVAVRPAPDAGQLLVTVTTVLPDEPLRPADVQSRLECAAGRLRSLIAGAITRKRAPKLQFQFVSPPVPGTGGETRIG